jgi:hypothetical protein
MQGTNEDVNALRPDRQWRSVMSQRKERCDRKHVPCTQARRTKMILVGEVMLISGSVEPWEGHGAEAHAQRAHPWLGVSAMRAMLCRTEALTQ